MMSSLNIVFFISFVLFNLDITNLSHSYKHFAVRDVGDTLRQLLTPGHGFATVGDRE